MKIIFPFLICVLEKLSSLNFVFNHNELIIQNSRIYSIIMSLLLFNKSKVRIIFPGPICAREKCIILLNS